MTVGTRPVRSDRSQSLRVVSVSSTSSLQVSSFSPNSFIRVPGVGTVHRPCHSRTIWTLVFIQSPRPLVSVLVVYPPHSFGLSLFVLFS